MDAVDGHKQWRGCYISENQTKDVKSVRTRQKDVISVRPRQFFR